MPSHQDMYRKLKSALFYVNNVCVLGTTNKLDDIQKTQGWATFCSFRYRGYGLYKNKKITKMTEIDQRINSKFDSEQGGFVPLPYQWFYHIESDQLNSSFHYKSRIPCENPLRDYPSDPIKINLLSDCLIILEKRSGNCYDRAQLIAKYLWEKPQNIFKIEIVRMQYIDHAFVILNRSGHLEDPSTWGDAWIVDGWADGSGLVYHASDYPKKIKEVIFFMKELDKKLSAVGFRPEPFSEREDLIIMCTINPELDCYPKYEPLLTDKSRQDIEEKEQFKPIEYYYLPLEYNTERNSYDWKILDEAKWEHENKFRKCLRDIIQYAPKDNSSYSFFSKKENVGQQHIEQRNEGLGMCK